MDEKKSPIDLLTEALANMTRTAMDAERERDLEKKRGDDWYKSYLDKVAENKELQTMLAAEIQGHENTRMQLEEATNSISKLESLLNDIATTPQI